MAQRLTEHVEQVRLVAADSTRMLLFAGQIFVLFNRHAMHTFQVQGSPLFRVVVPARFEIAPRSLARVLAYPALRRVAFREVTYLFFFSAFRTSLCQHRRIQYAVPFPAHSM